jgi:hypothetical protein
MNNLKNTTLLLNKSLFTTRTHCNAYMYIYIREDSQYNTIAVVTIMPCLFYYKIMSRNGSLGYALPSITSVFPIVKSN